ncbi:MAG TPA: type II toxin-antitoxin system VapC family toxin [Spirochaetota bacterium]|nr:type II toxin-antitoxin system VapC family toxin [Spirochaetota bacterium]HPN83139.1 type II toxin-antitoxin system VapC family toxin [Spirochaetota bacterium]
MTESVWLLDTHIWIRILNGDEALRLPLFQKQLQKHALAGNLRIAAISLWETAMLVAKDRLKLTTEAETWLSTAVTMPGLSVIPIDPAIAVESCSLPGDFHGDPADRLIVASARLIDATLITLDRQILDWAKSGWLRAVAPGNV